MARSLRLIRLLQILTVAKHFPALRDFHILVSGLFASGGTLLWSCALLAASIFVFAVLGAELIGNAPEWRGVDPGDEKSAASRFMRLESCMMTLTRFVLNDGAS